MIYCTFSIKISVCYTEAYISGMINWFYAIAKITNCKRAKHKVYQLLTNTNIGKLHL